MCLFTNDKTPVIAEKDIPCMKLVRKTQHIDGKVYYSSPFAFERAVFYIPGKTASMHDNYIHVKLTETPTLSLNFSEHLSNTPVSMEWLSDLHRKYGFICNLGLHSFHPKANGIRKVYDWLSINFFPFPQSVINEDGYGSLGITLLECRIPAGTLYYRGESNCLSEHDDERGYCSEYLEVIREIDIETYKK